MDLAWLHTIWTVLLVIAFVGIVIWAWSGKRKQTFEAAARAPLQEDARVPRDEREAPRPEHHHD